MGLLRKSLLGITVALCAALSSPAGAAEQGVRISIHMPKGSGEMPSPEKMVDALAAEGSPRRVLVTRRLDESGVGLNLDLWGSTPPAAEIPSQLRRTFPALEKAEIQCSTLDESLPPK
ncbi:hypothetical protein LZC95_02685 [Pendulispora brunnea]|uniref:Uncharacterized protein n=1 Tax=Pendulispora brunnea TaxID=2905690 RepID=A0ABZ2KAP0_9BACT